MTLRVQGPDGAVVAFPDGTDDATIDRVMRENFPGKSAPSPSQAAGLPAPSVNPFTGSREEARVTFGGTVSNAVGGFNEKVGGALFAPTNAFNSLLDKLTGGNTPNPTQETWDRLFNGPAPQNATERAVRRGGGFVAESLPFSAGAGVLAAGGRASTTSRGSQPASSAPR